MTFILTVTDANMTNK